MTGEVVTEKKFKENVEGMHEGLTKKFKDASVTTTFTDSIVKKDSIIKTYALNINLGSTTLKGMQEEQKEGIFDFLNKKLPSTALTTMGGKQIDLSKIEKPTVLNFWFTSCKPCIDEMPVLNELKLKYENEVDFIAITHEGEDKTKPFFDKHTFNFEHIIGAKGFAEELGIQSCPKNIFIDRNGIVKMVEDGIPMTFENDKLVIGDGKEFENKIRKIL